MLKVDVQLCYIIKSILYKENITYYNIIESKSYKF